MNPRIVLKTASIPALFFLFLLFPRMGRAQSTSASATPEPAQYVIEDLQGGHVQVLEEGTRDWEPAQEGQVLEGGDEIKVGDDSQATLMLRSETSVHLSAQSDMKVEQIEDNPEGGFLSRLQVLAGRLLADVKKDLGESHSSFEVESNGVVCGVRGTAFEVTAQAGGAEVATYEGEVQVGRGAGAYRVAAGNFSSFRHGRLLLHRRLDRMEIQWFKKWRAFRPLVFKERLRRLAEIRKHLRKPWVRRHPHPGRRLMRRRLEERRDRRWRRRE